MPSQSRMVTLEKINALRSPLHKLHWQSVRLRQFHFGNSELLQLLLATSSPKFAYVFNTQQHNAESACCMVVSSRVVATNEGELAQHQRTLLFHSLLTSAVGRMLHILLKRFFWVVTTLFPRAR